MLRLDLLNKLECVSPALAKNDVIPILTHFWFTGDTITTYNDQIGISVLFKSAFIGAVPNALIKLMKASRAKEVELTEENGEMSIKAASSKIKLAVLPGTKFPFVMPQLKDTVTDKLDISEFIACIDSCMHSVSTDVMSDDQLGITLVASKSKLSLYSTDDATMSYATLKLKGDLGFERIVLSAKFCKQMLTLHKSEQIAKLSFTDESAQLVTTKGTSLFGNLIMVDAPIDFQKAIEFHMPKAPAGMVPIPSKLKLVLERADVMTDNDSTTMDIRVANGKMRMTTKSGKGELYDSVLVGDEHPEVATKLEPKLLKQGYGDFDEILITETCAIMKKGTKFYLVAATES